MKKAIDGGKEDMKSILLIGLGRFGRHIAIKLDELNHQVMAVDNNESRVEAVLPYVRNAQIGDATNEDFIRSLGVRNFDVCIVAIGDNFQSSLETTSLLKELGAKMVVSRAARDVHAKFLLRNGADAWIGKTVGELDIRKKYNVNIMALRCNGVLDMNIASETLLGDDQTMLVLGNIKNIQKQFHI